MDFDVIKHYYQEFKNQNIKKSNSGVKIILVFGNNLFL